MPTSGRSSGRQHYNSGSEPCYSSQVFDALPNHQVPPTSHLKLTHRQKKTVTSSSPDLCQQHAETLLQQARYARYYGITKSLKGIYSEAQPEEAQMAPRGPGAAAAPPPGAAAATISGVKTGKIVPSRLVMMVRMGRVATTFRFQRHVLYHSTAKTNA